MVQLVTKAHGKALLVTGDTRPVKDLLKSLGGRWNSPNSGWMFPGSKHSSVVAALQAASHEVRDEFGGGATAESSSAASAPAAKKQKIENASAGAGAEDDGPASNDWSKGLSSEKRRVTVRKFNGQVFVDVREFWGDEPDVKPTKKGVMLKIEDWEALKGAIPSIDEEIRKLQ
eukprot:TRINITY_DN14124_c0_g1_i3.p3 TRINITY_DN14124_c0_g1~~TRINITY_DN14124_c0_g1_i3.p3  ORF type:complete len:173 (-),score=42.55 TRINITY_DN14124_c0_g1_i3:236-754(-)